MKGTLLVELSTDDADFLALANEVKEILEAHLATADVISVKSWARASLQPVTPLQTTPPLQPPLSPPGT